MPINVTARPRPPRWGSDKLANGTQGLAPWASIVRPVGAKTNSIPFDAPNFWFVKPNSFRFGVGVQAELELGSTMSRMLVRSVIGHFMAWIVTYRKFQLRLESPSAKTHPVAAPQKACVSRVARHK